MTEIERHSATVAVKWDIERAVDSSGKQFVALTFTDVNGHSRRVILHWGEAARFSAALAEDVRLNDPFREHRERYRQSDPDQER